MQEEILCDAAPVTMEGDHLQARLSRRLARNLELDDQDEDDDYGEPVDDSKITISRPETARAKLRKYSRMFLSDLKLLAAAENVFRNVVKVGGNQVEIDEVLAQFATSSFDVNQGKFKKCEGQ